MAQGTAAEGKTPERGARAARLAAAGGREAAKGGEGGEGETREKPETSRAFDSVGGEGKEQEGRGGQIDGDEGQAANYQVYSRQQVCVQSFGEGFRRECGLARDCSAEANLRGQKEGEGSSDERSRGVSALEG